MDIESATESKGKQLQRKKPDVLRYVGFDPVHFDIDDYSTYRRQREAN
jgi:hypothetical protein